MTKKSTFKELSQTEIQNLTDAERSAYWQAERDHENALRLSAMESLTPKQREVLKETHETLAHCVIMLHECHDLYMSDVGKLESAFYGLKHQFVLNEEESV